MAYAATNDASKILAEALKLDAGKLRTKSEIYESNTSVRTCEIVYCANGEEITYKVIIKPDKEVQVLTTEIKKGV